MVLFRKEEGEYWPRLIKSKSKVCIHNTCMLIQDSDHLLLFALNFSGCCFIAISIYCNPHIYYQFTFCLSASSLFISSIRLWLKPLVLCVGRLLLTLFTELSVCHFIPNPYVECFILNFFWAYGAPKCIETSILGSGLKYINNYNWWMWFNI